MAIARFRKVVLDANDPARLGRFWAEALDRRWEPDAKGEGGVFGATPQHTLWLNRVPQPKTVKHRVHLDIYASSLGDLEALGSHVVLPQGDDPRWTVMADPEGGEYCAFLREELPRDRLHGLVVDSADPAAQARWWARVYDARVVDDERGFSTVEGVPGMPILTMDFVPVPEPKSGPNRIHWDVSVADLRPLLEVGATVLRPLGEDIAWHVMADPEGNEFCAFVDADGG
jgi:catechol 2,3-dioxygenase-like lactoylglutathione lyase family enzyme